MFSYLGVVLGFVTSLILYPKTLTTTEYGLVTFITVAASLMGIFGQAGMPSVVVRFFPNFKDKEKQHNNFLSFVLSCTFIATSISLLFTFFLEGTIINLFSNETANNESLYFTQKYYWLIYALIPFLAFFNLLTSYSFNFQRTAITAFFRDVFIRTANIVLLLCVFFGCINFDTYIRGYVCIFWLQTLGMMLYLRHLGEFNLSFDFSAFSTQKVKEILSYSLVTMLTGSTIYLVNSIDSIMVGFFAENQLSDTGIFRVFFQLGIVIAVPYRALVAAYLPIISNAFKENDVNLIEKSYKNTSILMMGIGVLLFIILFVNLDNIITFIGKNYSSGKWVAVLIGLNALFNIATSINGVIIAQSKIYRYDLYLNLALVVINIILNYLLIKTFEYGLVGAAIATALTGIFYNFFKIIIVKWQFDIQPFQRNSVFIVLLGLCTFGLNYILPTFDFWLIDAIFRTLVLTIFYGGLLVYFNLIPAINNTLRAIVGKFR